MADADGESEPAQDDARLISAAETTAASLLRRAARLRTRAQRQRSDQVQSMIEDPASRDFMIELTDEVLRSADPRAAARRFAALVRRHDAPGFASSFDKGLLQAAALSSRITPGLVVSQVRARVRKELSAVVLDADPAQLRREISARSAAGFMVNVNPLGDGVLGDQEAQVRLGQALELLRRTEVRYLSVRAPAVCAGLDVLDFDGSVARIADAVEQLCVTANETPRAAFVSLDTTEFADLWLTVRGFMQALDRPGLRSFHAGIALQAYLPESVEAFDELSEWAQDRVDAGGAGIKIRLVKGANLALERVDAELHGWNSAPLPTKADVDANYKRLVDRALDPELVPALRVGVASHNLFDLAWALSLAIDRRVGDQLDIELLHGVADAEAQAVLERVTTSGVGRVVLYTPVVESADFSAATAYLVRRFDESTSPESFLTHLPGMALGSPTWLKEAARFRTAVIARHEPVLPSRRGTPLLTAGDAFSNAADSDLALASTRDRVRDALSSFTFPDVVSSRFAAADTPPGADSDYVDGIDPSTGAVSYRVQGASSAGAGRAVAAAMAASARWRRVSPDDRRRVLDAVADVMESERFSTIAVMAHETGTTVRDADPEVSQAIDFARYYGRCALELEAGPAVRFDPYRVVVVASPCNAPYAVPAGGVLAALAAGSAVILTPAPESVLVAVALAEQCWKAGVPHDVLQLLVTASPEVGRELVTHSEVDAVILTGSSATADQFRRWKPDLRLHGETSGKNAIVVTAGADLDDAIRAIVRSAFGHAGQWSSSASLVIAEAPVLDNTRFLERLADRVASLRVGPATSPATQLGPLIRPPLAPLQNALTQLADGESWLVEPQPGDHDRCWTPGVRIGVQPGSAFHLTAHAGPVLGIMRAAGLDDAIRLQNQIPYGLTAGIFSLDDEEIARWLGRAEAGNLYVNRHITGAIVQRQPFGGWKRSAAGAGIKTGGPFYVASLGTWHDNDGTTPEQFARQALAVWEHWRAGNDPSGLRAEQNVLRLRALTRGVLLWAGEGVAAGDLVIVQCIADEVDVHLQLCTPRDTAESEFVELAASGDFDRVRVLGTPSPGLLSALAAEAVDVDLRPVSGNPAMELLCWTREQAISRTLHRHGNPRPIRPPP